MAGAVYTAIGSLYSLSKAFSALGAPLSSADSRRLD